MKLSDLFDGKIVAYAVVGSTVHHVGKVELLSVTVRDAQGYERQVQIESLDEARESQKVQYWYDRCMKAEDDLVGVGRVGVGHCAAFTDALFRSDAGERATENGRADRSAAQEAVQPR